MRLEDPHCRRKPPQAYGQDAAQQDGKDADIEGQTWSLRTAVCDSSTSRVPVLLLPAMSASDNWKALLYGKKLI